MLIKLTSNEFEIVADEMKELNDDIINALLDSEVEDADYGNRLNLMSKGPCRCLLVTQGSQGVVEALSALIGPGGENPPPDGVT